MMRTFGKCRISPIFLSSEKKKKKKEGKGMKKKKEQEVSELQRGKEFTDYGVSIIVKSALLLVVDTEFWHLSS